MLPKVKKEEDRKVALGFDDVELLVTLPGRSECIQEMQYSRDNEQLLRQILQEGKQRNVTVTGGKCSFYGSNSPFPLLM